MASTFFGIEIGRRALAASQQALEVVGQNTANVNTPGYSRQVVTFEATDPYSLPDSYPTRPRQIGTGVNITAIKRVRDEFIDQRIQDANSILGSLTNLQEIAGRVEEAFTEPGITGIGQVMTDFFNAFSDLSANPESGAIRATVRNRAEALVAAFHTVDTAMKQLAPEITSRIGLTVADVNTIARQIAELNKQIRVSLTNKDIPNDLMDKRGDLLDQLSKLADIQVINSVDGATGKPNGEVQVNVGGYALVLSNTVNPLPTNTTVQGENYYLVTDSGVTLPIQGGALHGLVKAQTLLESYQSDLDTLASSLTEAVNAIHSVGYGLDGLTGRNFFAVPASPGSVTAGSLALDANVLGNLDSIAAASPPAPPNTFAPGNGDSARQIAALTSTAVVNGLTLNDFYNSNVALIGADVRSFQTQADNQEKVITMLQNHQASVSGVSLDEELVRMMQYQRAYQAAARIINTMDDALDRIINGLGLGR